MAKKSASAASASAASAAPGTSIIALNGGSASGSWHAAPSEASGCKLMAETADKSSRIRRRPALEARVVAEEAEQIGVVLHQPDNDAPQRLVVLDPGILLVRVFPCILVGGIDRNPLRDLLGDQAAYAIAVRPGNVSPLVVKRSQDV